MQLLAVFPVEYLQSVRYQPTCDSVLCRMAAEVHLTQGMDEASARKPLHSSYFVSGKTLKKGSRHGHSRHEQALISEARDFLKEHVEGLTAVFADRVGSLLTNLCWVQSVSAACCVCS